MRTECRLAIAFVSVGLFFAGLETSPLPAAGAAAERSPFQVEMKREGTFALYFHRVPLINTEFKFWQANWKWANPDHQAGPFHDGAAPFSLRVPTLAAEAVGTIEMRSPDVVVYDLTVRHGPTAAGVMGGGIEFQLNLKSPLFNGQPAPDPVLLPDNTGWTWPLGPGRDIRVVFAPGVRKVYFEANNKARIRAFFIGEATSASTERLRMAVTFPQGTERLPSEEEEYGPNGGTWLPNVFPSPQCPVDLSTLNHTPGTHGFLRAKGDRLVFEDGTPARFWGVDVMAFALFSPNDQIAKHARRLAMLGFNLVRLHHHDSTSWVDPTVIDKKGPSSRLLDAGGIDRLDYWIKCLRENGIYVWLDMHTNRQFRPGDRNTNLGNVATFPEFMTDKRSDRQVKGYCQYDPVVQKLMAEFQEKYLTHVNRYTGLAYKDDPTIAFVLVTNENDITHHYGVLAMPRSNHAQLNRLFSERIKLFSEKTGLSEREIRIPWNPGPAKIFLNDQEHTFYSTMIGSIRGTGSRALVAAGNVWGDEPLSSIPSLMTGDVIDVHAYDGAGQLTADPRYKPNIVSMIGINQVTGKPLTVSEWNLEAALWPTIDRYSAPLYVASIAALQGWDAMMLYGYCQQTLSDTSRATSVWDAFNDPGLLASMPAAALLYRNGHVAPAKKEYCLALSREQMFGPPIRPESSAAARTLMEQSRFTIGIPATPELDWLKPATPPDSAQIIHEPDESFLSPTAQAVESDTHELRRQWDPGIQTIDTPKTQVVQGAIGEKQFKLSDVTVLVTSRHAAVAVSALDEQPLRSSSLILVTTVARVEKPRRLPGRAGWYQDFSVLSEPVRGEITVRAPAGLEAVKLMADGGTLPLENTTFEDGVYRIPLQKQLSHWYLLRKKATP